MLGGISYFLMIIIPGTFVMVNESRGPGAVEVGNTWPGSVLRKVMSGLDLSSKGQCKKQDKHCRNQVNSRDRLAVGCVINKLGLCCAKLNSAYYHYILYLFLMGTNF